jgi:hypothetical protein
LLLIAQHICCCECWFAVLQAAVAVGPVEDLAGFVHMHMIDDLLSGAE